MTTKNPFPGMNPFFEQQWQDAHTRLITYICETLQERLPVDLVARSEEQVVGIGSAEQPETFRPDVSVKQPWDETGAGGVAAAVAAPVRAPTATKPTRIFLDDEVERWVEIHDEAGRLVTAIELLSPSNKVDEPARTRFCAKRRTLVSARVNVVEIDLVRRGASVFPEEARELMRKQGAPYATCVFRASHFGEREVYVIGLRERLPIISIPLRSTDVDIALELQPLIDQCHERGRYHRLRYRMDPQPPFAPADAAWVQEILRQHELL